MAFCSTPSSPSLCLPLKKRTPFANRPSSVSLLSSGFGSRREPFSIRASSAPSVVPSESIKPAISLTVNALNHLNKMRSDRKEDLCLRIGVKQGGCSGMSYMMEFEDQANMRPDDSIIEYEGFVIVCDPKSLLFIYGMQLDFSDALIGGGFSFKNPNATQTCGCGKSFAA